jgi:hypothetical protein
VRAGDEPEQAEALCAGMGKKRAVHAEIQHAGKKTPEATEDSCSLKLMEGSGSCHPPRDQSRHDNTGNENHYYYSRAACQVVPSDVEREKLVCAEGFGG